MLGRGEEGHWIGMTGNKFWQRPEPKLGCRAMMMMIGTMATNSEPGPSKAMSLMKKHVSGILMTQWKKQVQLSSILDRRGSRGGARGPRPPLSDHTTIIKFSYPVLKYILHSFSIV